MALTVPCSNEPERSRRSNSPVFCTYMLVFFTCELEIRDGEKLSHKRIQIDINKHKKIKIIVILEPVRYTKDNTLLGAECMMFKEVC